MSTSDRRRWDERYASSGESQADEVGLAAPFAPFADMFPSTGHALDLACGRGAAGVWLARRGMNVVGLDVSPVAIEQAGALARSHGVAGRCRFEVADLDDGLPTEPPANVIVCQRFRDARLDDAITRRLAPGGLFAISALSEVGASRGRFRVRAGELSAAFGALDVIAHGEGDGQAWLLARG